MFEAPLADLLASGGIPFGSLILVGVQNNELFFAQEYKPQIEREALLIQAFQQDPFDSLTTASPITRKGPAKQSTAKK